MTISVKLTMRTDKTLELVKMLKADGYVQGVDFDFAHQIPRWDYFSHEPVEQPYTLFTFYNKHVAFMFQLKYSGN
jgi:gamma-glutamyl:cysteine ligase YbdK (ATP-grasp superfamily)